MKKFVRLVSNAVGFIMLAVALTGVILGLGSIATAAPTPSPSTCPLNFGCELGGVPTWVICLIPLALLLLIIILIVALSRRRTIQANGR